MISLVWCMHWHERRGLGMVESRVKSETEVVCFVNETDLLYIWWVSGFPSEWFSILSPSHHSTG
jgi:hypothetical protein